LQSSAGETWKLAWSGLVTEEFLKSPDWEWEASKQDPKSVSRRVAQGELKAGRRYSPQATQPPIKDFASHTSACPIYQKIAMGPLGRPNKMKNEPHFPRP